MWAAIVISQQFLNRSERGIVADRRPRPSEPESFATGSSTSNEDNRFVRSRRVCLTTHCAFVRLFFFSKSKLSNTFNFARRIVIADLRLCCTIIPILLRVEGIFFLSHDRWYVYQIKHWKQAWRIKNTPMNYWILTQAIIRHFR